jgi:hypothetical protein
MNLGASANDLPLFIVFTLLTLALIPLTLAILAALARLFSRILHIAPGWIMFVLSFGLMGALLVGLPLYLDRAATVVMGNVSDKIEHVEIRPQGTWRNQLSVSLQYSHAGELGSTTLHLAEAEYDALSKGEAAELRVLPLFRSVAIVKLAALDPYAIVPVLLWWWLGGLAVFLFVWQLANKSTAGRGVLFVVGIGLLVGIPSLRTVQAWQAAEAVAMRPLRTEATVIAINRITEIDYLPCYDDCTNRWDTRFTARPPFDIVQMTFVPEGKSEAVVAVDSADAVGLENFSALVDDTITIAYAPETPRDAQIIGVTHSHHWRNAVYFAAINLALLLSITLPLLWLYRRGRQRVNTP